MAAPTMSSPSTCLPVSYFPHQTCGRSENNPPTMYSLPAPERVRWTAQVMHYSSKQTVNMLKHQETQVVLKIIFREKLRWVAILPEETIEVVAETPFCDTIKAFYVDRCSLLLPETAQRCVSIALSHTKTPLEIRDDVKVYIGQHVHELAEIARDRELKEMQIVALIEVVKDYVCDDEGMNSWVDRKMGFGSGSVDIGI